MDIQRSPDGKKILLLTDSSLGLLYKVHSDLRFRTIYGLDNDQLSLPKAVFSADGSVLYIVCHLMLAYKRFQVKEKYKLLMQKRRML